MPNRIEPLEGRLFMRRGGVSFEGRTLPISGTAGDDVISYRGEPGAAYNEQVILLPTP